MFTLAILYYASYWGTIQVDTTKYQILKQHQSSDICRAESVAYEVNRTGGKKHKYLMLCIREQ